MFYDDRLAILFIRGFAGAETAGYTRLGTQGLRVIAVQYVLLNVVYRVDMISSF
jgi:hypothetical protein